MVIFPPYRLTVSEKLNTLFRITQLPSERARIHPKSDLPLGALEDRSLAFHFSQVNWCHNLVSCKLLHSSRETNRAAQTAWVRQGGGRLHKRNVVWGPGFWWKRSRKRFGRGRKDIPSGRLKTWRFKEHDTLWHAVAYSWPIGEWWEVRQEVTGQTRSERASQSKLRSDRVLWISGNQKKLIK